jgi:D-glycero-D-manno-heptose 1,7-bisphosphate phosphatase
MADRPDAVLLDRDGTVNVKAPAGEYITRPEQLRLLPGAAEAIKVLNKALVPVVIVTNQRGIALGRMTEDDLGRVHARLGELLADRGARVDGIFYCPHDRGRCACRKPATLLLERARDYLELVDLRQSLVIGDSCSDVIAGRAVGARAVLLSDHHHALDGVERGRSLFEVVQSAVGPAVGRLCPEPNNV